MTTEAWKTKALPIAAIVLLIAALAVWWLRPHDDVEDARLRRAEQACLSNTASERGGKVTTVAEVQDAGVRGEAGVTSRDTQVRGPNERVAAGDFMKESDAIRACIDQYLARGRS